MPCRCAATDGERSQGGTTGRKNPTPRGCRDAFEKASKAMTRTLIFVMMMGTALSARCQCVISADGLEHQCVLVHVDAAHSATGQREQDAQRAPAFTVISRPDSVKSLTSY